MDEGASRLTDTPEGSAGGEELSQSGSKIPAVKDRKCQYCQQSFTSSSLGRHLDQFLFKKKPDGIHDVEEIRRIRSGITRRQARTSSGKRDSPEHGIGKGQSDAYRTADSGSKPRDHAVRMMFNTPTWHATGVINDIPNPSSTLDGSGSSRLSSSQPRPVALGLPDYASRGASANNPDTARALELALREVLDNIKAATSSRARPRVSPFDFDIQSQTFPSLCLQLLPPPPCLYASHPFPSPGSFPLQPPGLEHVEIVRQALRTKIDQWKSDELASDSTNSSHGAKSGMGLDQNMINRSAQQHEEMSSRHLDLVFKHWMTLSVDSRTDTWQLEITRAFAREAEKRKALDEQLARVQQEANQLRAQVEKLGSCQWPREFALFPPDILPLPRDVARELDVKESLINPSSPRWDYDSVVAKWKRVVMHDKGMGRIGVGYANSVIDDQATDGKPRTGEDFGANRGKSLQPSAALSPDTSSTHVGGLSVLSNQGHQNTPPYLYPDHRRSPKGPHTKRPRLMNGHFEAINHGTEGESTRGASNSQAATQATNGTSNTWNSHSSQTLHVSTLGAPSAPSPPPSNSSG